MEIWRVDLTDKSLKRESVPTAWERLGGRGLIAKIMMDEVDPECDPLGPKNKLIFAPGLLVGHMLSSSDRLSIGAKSPLTGGIKEANTGGSTGLKMVYLGIKVLILEGCPSESSWSVLRCGNDGIQFDSAEDLIGKGVYESAEDLLQIFGKDIGAALIGPGGERGYRAAGIMNLDKDRIPGRVAARGGLGAVMGSKKLKAIVFDAKQGIKPEINDIEKYKTAQKTFTKALLDHPQVKVYADFGTPAMSRMSDSFGGLPTNNFSSGTFDGIETISAEYMREELIQRGGDSETTHACMAGCTIRCSNVYADKQGKSIVSPLEYETVGLLGPNLGIDDLDIVARLNWECNDLGLDTIDIGAALGVAADAGILTFGNGNQALQLMKEIRENTFIGKILGQGAAITGKVLGISRVPVVKGQAMSAYDPRSIKGTGVTYATSPQGADHTCGSSIRAKVDHLDPTVQVDLSRTLQINMAGYDTLGVCMFASFGFSVVPQTIMELINARYGWGVGTDFLQLLGKTTLELEREFNRRAGFTAADDRIPEWMTLESLPPLNSVFDVNPEDMDKVFNW